MSRSDGDRAGIAIASLCFVHCIAGPVLLTLAGFSALVHVSEKFEPAFLISSAAVGTMALVPAYLKRHRRPSCLAMFGCGLVCLFAKRYVESPAIPAEPIFTGLGASLLIGAHLLNLKFLRRCRCCDPSGEQDGQEVSHARGDRN